MFRNLLTQTADIENYVRGPDDDYGDHTYIWSSSGTFPCKLDAVNSTELEVDRNTRTTFFQLFLGDEAENVITALSRVVVEGTTYQVVGEPIVHRRRARVSHVEASLRVVVD